MTPRILSSSPLCENHPLLQQYKALRKARTLLEGLAQNTSLPSSLQEEAVEALRQFPSFDPAGNPLFFPSSFQKGLTYNPKKITWFAP